MRIDQVAPALYVGLGGAGGEVVGRISTMLKRKWDAEVYKEMARFVVIDTDKVATVARRQGLEESGPVNESILISDFNKEEYARSARGLSYGDPDPYFTQWVYPDYKFRAGDSAGAGQIRIESRLGLFRALRSPEIRIAEKLQAQLAGMRKHLHTLGRTGECSVHIVFSTAGGTGSGTFLTIAYLIQDIAAKDSISAKVFGYALQPHIYRDVVGDNFSDVCANGYAALMELEYANKVSVQGKYEPFEFHFDSPERISKKPMVSKRPFDMTFIVDIPEKHSSSKAEVHKALADIIFMQATSPLGGIQASDADNYDKYSRALYPDDIFNKLGDGYSTFFGSMGMCILQVPDDDIARYCELRFASQAIRSYLLMDDPSLLPEKLREDFKRFIVRQEELDKLDEEKRLSLLNEKFTGKMEFLAEAFKDDDGNLLGSITDVKDEAQKKFDAAFESLVTQAVSGIQLHKLASGNVQDDWISADPVNNLFKETETSRQRVETSIEDLLRNRLPTWWPDFLKDLGNPYRQRYALAILRGYSNQTPGPLSSKKLEEVEGLAAQAPEIWKEARQKQFYTEMEGQATALRSTQPSNWYQKLGKGREIEESLIQTRETTLRQFNLHRDLIEGAFKKIARAKILKTLATEADKLLRLFQDIERNAASLAEGLDKNAFDYMKSGAFSEKMLDGSQKNYFSEANQYAIDEEALMAPSGERMWDWYYEDQIAPIMNGADQIKAIVNAMADALKPERTEQGIPRPLEADRVVTKITFNIRDEIRPTLDRVIRGEGEGATGVGLKLDDAIALEALYIQLKYRRDAATVGQPTLYRNYMRRSLSFYQGAGGVLASQLWRHPELGEAITLHASEKVRKCHEVKADLFSKVDENDLEKIRSAKKLLIGAQEKLYRGESAFGKIIDSTDSNPVPDWYDPKRIVFFRYYVGIPIYVYPNVTRELQEAYQKHQAKGSSRAWYLHTDLNFDNGNIPGLDPKILKALVHERHLMTVPLLFARKVVAINKATGEVRLVDPAVPEKLMISRSLLDVMQGLHLMRSKYPEIYRRFIQPVADEAAAIFQYQNLASDDRASLADLEKRMIDRIEALERESEDIRDVHLMEALRKYLELTRKMLAMKGRTVGDVEDDSLF